MSIKYLTEGLSLILCAMTELHEVFCYGNNTQKQLGIGPDTAQPDKDGQTWYWTPQKVHGDFGGGKPVVCQTP